MFIWSVPEGENGPVHRYGVHCFHCWSGLHTDEAGYYFWDFGSVGRCEQQNDLA